MYGLESIKRLAQSVWMAARGTVDDVLYERIPPSFLIIGTQKGGTNSLFTYLANHPQVLPSTEKEVNFFNSDGRYARGTKFYHTYFPHKTPQFANKLTFEGTPAYLRRADKVASRIYDYNPAMKLIALLRNPIDRAFSAWQMYRRYYQQNSNWFFDWMEQFESELPKDMFVRRTTDFGENFEQDIRNELELFERDQMTEMPILDGGHYFRQLQHFVRLFEKQQILIMQSERFFSETLSELQRVEAFLTLNPHSWSHDQLKPQFGGGYENEMSEFARCLLGEFYQRENALLYGLIGTDYNWS